MSQVALSTFCAVDDWEMLKTVRLPAMEGMVSEE
jgi:hypothetical protein